MITCPLDSIQPPSDISLNLEYNETTTNVTARCTWEYRGNPESVAYFEIIVMVSNETIKKTVDKSTKEVFFSHPYVDAYTVEVTAVGSCKDKVSANETFEQGNTFSILTLQCITLTTLMPMTCIHHM